MNALDLLKNDDLALSVAAIASPHAVRQILAARKDVSDLSAQFLRLEIDAAEVRHWVAELLSELKRGERFAHEAALCALAVALESVPGSEPEKFLHDLAALRVQELALAYRVAEVATSYRGRALAANSSGQLCIAHLTTTGITPSEAIPFRIDVSSESEHLTIEAA